MVDRYSYRRESEISNYSHSNHPSFSSTLLDAIYRSIDQGEEEIVIYRETMRKKQQNNSTMVKGANVRGAFQSEEEIANFQRACMIEKWMEKKVSEKVVVRRESTAAADSQVKKSSKDGEENSSSSSWDSSCGGGGGAGFFSSSDVESFYGKRPTPIRVGDSGLDKEKFSRHEKPNKNQDGFLKKKSRALKIYGDLKKVKQPISPGGRLAGFLNSLFASTGYQKKPKMKNSDNSPILKSANPSTCSSASSFSRSCLSKTPSSRGKSNGGEKRSVRFSPVSVIVDEDCQPCGHKSLHEEINNKKQSLEAVKNNTKNSIITNAINEEMMVHVMEKNRRVEEAARDLLRNYQKKMDCEFPFDLRKTHIKNQAFDQEFDEELEEEDDDDDAASYASSDLFELDNLSAIGMERYREELPVYETTHLRTNRAIANGFIL